MHPADCPQTDRPVGLIAGWGRYPLVLAEALRRRGCRLVGLGVKDHVDPRLRGLCDVYEELGLGQIGRGLRVFRHHRVHHATMAGKVHKVELFRPFYWWRHFPDWECVRTFFPHFVSQTRDFKDDSLLGTVVAAFARYGITMVPATDLLPEVLVKMGILSQRHPTRREARDIAFGWQLAKQMGGLDIGQTVVVKGLAVLAVEAIEGTDLCIRRAGELCTAGGLVVVKVAKPQQDMRFDVPTVGLKTLESLVAAGGRVLAIEAEKTILIDEPQVVDFANRHRVALVATRDGASDPLGKAA
jgi:DUF1009 family protein